MIGRRRNNKTEATESSEPRTQKVRRREGTWTDYGTRFGSFLAIMAIVVGVPAALVWFAGNPLPESMPAWNSIRGRLESGSIPSEVLINVIAVVLWFWWLNLVIPIIVEFISTLRSVRGPDLLLLPGSQTLARNLVAGLFVLTNTIGSIGGAPSLAGVAPAPVVMQVDQSASGEVAVQEIAAEAEERAADAAQVHETLYEVKRGDTLRSLADRALGDAGRWREIRSVSVGLAQSDGSVLPPTFTSLSEGMSLRMPPGTTPEIMDDLRDLSSAPPAATVGPIGTSASVEEPDASGAEMAADPEQRSESITVENGDHFWKIAEREVEASDADSTPENVERYWRALVTANSEAWTESGDPDLIHPGATINLLDADEVLTGDATTTTDLSTVTVRDGDNLWDLSEQALTADLDRAPTEAETRAYWQEVVHANTAALQSGDANVIHPGESISLPGRRSPEPTPAETPDDVIDLTDTAATSAGIDTVERAEKNNPRAAVIAAAESAAEADPESADDDIDWWLAPPAAALAGASTGADLAPPTQSDAEAAEPEAPTDAGMAAEVLDDADVPDAQPAELVPTTATVDSSPGTGPDGPGPDESLVGLGTAALLGVGTTVAAGVIHRLNQRRAAQQRHRPRNHDVAEPSPEAVEIEAQLRAIASRETLDWVTVTQQALVGLTATSDDLTPAISLVRAGHQGFELLFDTLAPDAPEGFVATDRVWGIEDGTSLDSLREISFGQAPLMPALVTIGEQAGHVVMLDLEHSGLIEVRGDAARTSALYNSIALELSTAPWANDVQVIIVGDDQMRGALDGVTVMDPASDWQKHILTLARETDAIIGEARSTHAARCVPDTADDFQPTVVLVAAGVALSPELIDAALSPTSGIAVVATTMTRSEWSIELHPDGMGVLDPTGMSMRTAGVSDAVVTSIIENASTTAEFVERRGDQDEAYAWAVPLEDPAPTEDVSGRDERVDADATWNPDDEPTEADGPRADSADSPGVETNTQDAVSDAVEFIAGVVAPSGVELTVFGPPNLTGDVAGKVSRRDIEITALLALKDPAPSVQVVRDAIFNRGAAFADDRPPPAQKTVLSAISRTRSTLGESTEGRRLPRGTKDGSGYRLVDVGVDWHRVEALIDEARRVAHQGARVRLLEAALRYVTGQPLQGIVDDSYGWAFADRQIVSRIEAVATDAAIELAELALAMDDPDLAGWASERGVMVVRGHAELYRQMMRAYAAKDGPDGARRAYNEFLRVTRDIDPHEELDPVTVRLLGVLVRGSQDGEESESDRDHLADVLSMTAR